MYIYIFFRFPDDDDVCECIKQNPNIVKEVLISLKRLRDSITDKSFDVSLVYDGTELNAFLDAVEILDEGSHINTHGNLLKSYLYKSGIDILDCDRSDPSYTYACWNLKDGTNNPDFDVPNILKNLCHYEKAGLFSFRKRDSENTEIDIIMDAIHVSGLPRLFKVPVFVCPGDCIDWLKTCCPGDFSLANDIRFERTTYRWGKQTMYLEKSSGNLWYYDYYHKDNGHPHYEVFQPDGTHLGEADEQGVMIDNSKDHDKSISHVLHGK